MVTDHLSRLVNEDVTHGEKEICDEFPDESLLSVSERSWFVDIANFKETGIIHDDLNWHQRKKFFHDAHSYVWDDPHLFKLRAYNLLRRCVTKEKARSILWHCCNSPYGGHYNGDRTTTKVLRSRCFWPLIFRDAHEHVLHYDQCQRTGCISRRNKMPLQNIIEVEVFDC